MLLAALFDEERLGAENVWKFPEVEMLFQFCDTVCGGGRLHEGDLVTCPSVLLKIRGIAIVMAPSKHHTLAFLQVQHEVKVLSGLEVCFFLAAANIDKLKEGLSLAKPATKLCEFVFFMYDAGLHQGFGEAFDVQVYLGHNSFYMVLHIGRLQVCLDGGMELMGSLAATLLALGQVLFLEQRTVAINY